MRFLPPLGLSKHATICFTLTADSKPKEYTGSTPKYNYHRADKEKMRELVDQVDWEEAFANKSVNGMWDTFIENYKRIVKICVPNYVSRPGCSKPKWMTRRLETLIRRKQEAWRKYRSRKNAAHRELYNNVRNMVTREVRTAKYAYEKKIALDATSNTKHFWAYVRSKTTAKASITRLKTQTGEITEDDETIAQVMNKAFNGVYVREDTGLPSVTPDSIFQGPKLQDITLSREDVKKRLKGLDESKAQGPDGVSPLVLKECADTLCSNTVHISSLTRIWNCA